MKSQEESTMALNPQRFFMPSFCWRPLLLPGDCVDSLHLQNDASVLLCATSKQTVTTSRQRPPLEPTDQSRTVRRIARPGRWQECSLIFSFVVVWSRFFTWQIASSFYQNVSFPCMSSLGPLAPLHCPPGVQPTFLVMCKKKNGNEESRSNFLGAGYTTHLEFPPLIFLLGKKKPFSGHWESDFHYPLGSPTPFLEITPYFLQS